MCTANVYTSLHVSRTASIMMFVGGFRACQHWVHALGNHLALTHTFNITFNANMLLCSKSTLHHKAAFSTSPLFILYILVHYILQMIIWMEVGYITGYARLCNKHTMDPQTHIHSISKLLFLGPNAILQAMASRPEAKSVTHTTFSTWQHHKAEAQAGSSMSTSSCLACMQKALSASISM